MRSGNVGEVILLIYMELFMDLTEGLKSAGGYIGRY